LAVAMQWERPDSAATTGRFEEIKYFCIKCDLVGLHRITDGMYHDSDGWYAQHVMDTLLTYLLIPWSRVLLEKLTSLRS
jgi:hypothetical protein